MSKRFYEFIEENRVEDTRSGDEIAYDIIQRAGLRFKEDDHGNLNGTDG